MRMKYILSEFGRAMVIGAGDEFEYLKTTDLLRFRAQPSVGFLDNGQKKKKKNKKNIPASGISVTGHKLTQTDLKAMLCQAL